MEEIGTPIKDYIESATTQIKNSLTKDIGIAGIVNIEMSTVLQKEKGGGIKIKVLNLGTKVSENQIQKITIPLKIMTDSDKAMEEARKAEAEAKKAMAERIKKEAR